MALTVACDTTRVISIRECVEQISSDVNLSSPESALQAVPMLKAVANNRSLIVDRLNQAVEANFRGEYIRSAQAFILGQTADFFIRAAIWPPLSSVATGRLYQDKFSYNVAHDHNFNFITVNHLGPGYDTDIYEYDYERVVGYIGESVDLRFLERKRFGAGSAMLYRANKDVHIQHPPPELTITLNLIWAPDDVRMHEQFIFDVDRRQISGYAVEGEANHRISALRMAARIGDSQTKMLLDDLSKNHPCRRTRLAAFEALATLDPSNAVAIWEQAVQDPAPLVVRAAREELSKLGN